MPKNNGIKLAVNCSRLAVLISLTFGPIALHAGTIEAYVEAPTVQSSSVGGITTETFNGLPVGFYGTSVSTAIGTYEGTSADPFEIISADQYGGAGGSGNYFAVGSETGSPGVDAVTLDLSSENNYFGFWWSAGDVNNSITLLQNGTVLATFTTAELVALLPNSSATTVTAIDGAQYNTINYYGNPNDGQDANEPFAYVDIIATGLEFNQVLFSNPGNTGFESDNHSVANGVTQPPSGDVIIGTLQLTTPEPTSWALAILGLGALIFGRIRVVRRT